MKMKYLNVKVSFIVVAKPNAKNIPDLVTRITEELNIAMSKIEKQEGVKQITAFYVNSEDW